MELLLFIAMKLHSAKKGAGEAHSEKRAPPALGKVWQFGQPLAGVRETAKSSGNPRI
jgi:hypothetical protein